MNQPQNLDAAVFIRRSAARQGERTAATPANSTSPTTVNAAIAQLNPKDKSSHRLLTVMEDLGTVRQRAKNEAMLRREALAHESRLRLKALAGEAARIEAHLDISINEMHAALAANVLASEGELLRTLETVRRQIEQALLSDRFVIVQQFLDAHTAGRLADEELQTRLDSVFADFRDHDERIGTSARRCIDEASTLLRPARG